MCCIIDYSVLNQVCTKRIIMYHFDSVFFMLYLLSYETFLSFQFSMLANLFNKMWFCKISAIDRSINQLYVLRADSIHYTIANAIFENKILSADINQ